MSATINTIASNSEKARVISAEAGTQAVSVAGLMGQLGKAAQSIGKVTETINSISFQTNLLALNAAIEAAHAGAYGKCFAVVAKEIKELAKNTETASDEIKEKIGGVQNLVGTAIKDIGRITVVISDMGQIVTAIASSIDEQAVVTKDVAGSIAKVSSGMQEVNKHMLQSAEVSKTLAQSMQ
jgi:methyl-accepting chemotaxis protein